MSKLLIENKELIDDVHVAIGKAEGYIPCRNLHEEIIAWQYLIDTGMAWKLQGWFGRQAMFLIEQGLCTKRVVH